MSTHTPAPSSLPAARTAARPLAAALGLGLAALLACGAPQAAQAGTIVGSAGADALAMAQAAQGAELVVTGTASVSVEPDLARVTLSVSADADTAAAAAQAASDAAADVRDALLGAGVGTDELTSSGVAVYPRYAYAQDGTSEVSGYSASVSFEARGVALDGVADVVGDALQAGATRVDELAYYASGYDDAYARALALAAAQARGKARALAAAELGSAEGDALMLDKIEEQPSSQAYRYAEANAMDNLAYSTGEGKADVSASVNPGTVEVEATVTATYRAWDSQALATAGSGA